MLTDAALRSLLSRAPASLAGWYLGVERWFAGSTDQAAPLGGMVLDRIPGLESAPRGAPSYTVRLWFGGVACLREEIFREGQPFRKRVVNGTRSAQWDADTGRRAEADLGVEEQTLALATSADPVVRPMAGLHSAAMIVCEEMAILGRTAFRVQVTPRGSEAEGVYWSGDRREFAVDSVLGVLLVDRWWSGERLVAASHVTELRQGVDPSDLLFRLS